MKDKILQQRENTEYLPGHTLAPNILPVLEWDEIHEHLDDKSLDLIVSGLPMKSLHTFFSENHQHVSTYLKQKTPLVSLSKE